MQIVIDIPDGSYEELNNGQFPVQDAYRLVAWIKDGTPLPKGHKVIDAYALQEHLALVAMEDRTYREAVEIIDRFPSIIEADRSEKTWILTM